MLLLSRNVGQSIIINDDIKIKFLRMNSRNQLLLGVEAPLEIQVFREEVYEKVVKERNRVKASQMETWYTVESV